MDIINIHDFDLLYQFTKELTKMALNCTKKYYYYFSFTSFFGKACFGSLQ